jgi:hypothetical protein
MLEWTSWWGMGAENRHVVSSTLLLDVIKVVDDDVLVVPRIKL